MDDFFGGPAFEPGLVGPNGKLCRLHKGPKPQKPSAQQLKMERQQMALLEAQMAEMERVRNMPTPEAPKPMPQMAPTTMQSAADLEQAAAEARRASLTRYAPGRSTIFAGESGSNLGGRKTILG